jgi:hypothetical protein
MSCALTKGRAEVCKDAIGGLKNIYFANFTIDPADITYDSTDTDLITDITGVSDLYKYELKGVNSFTQTITSSRDTGTTFFDQVLSVEFKKQDVATSKEIKILSYGRPHIVVEDNNGNYFIAGLLRGCDVTAGEIASGVTLGEMSGYKLTFSGQEKPYANFLDCTSQAGLATLFATGGTDATIVAS